MITPSPTTKIAPYLCRGVLEQIVPESATKGAYVVVSFPDTSYRLHLVATAEIQTPPGKKVIGVIRARARRVDVVQTGGRFVEPVIGRPRRVQGHVLSSEPSTNSITVNAGVPIVCVLTDARQSASQFEPGLFVSFDVMDGATLTPEQPA
ncbi:MAG: hypothetical protein JNL50_03500 [Phycisphaerae bacterium]|nr:hypothetical protein [Phycisphaerae bacterium]